MKRLLIVLIFNLLILFSLNAQINIELILPTGVKTDGDTLFLCQDTYIFTANVSYTDGSQFNDTTTWFSWNYGDNDFDNGDFMKSVSHKFNGGAYYFTVAVEDENKVKAQRVYPVIVSVNPYFKDTKAESDEYCKWDKIKLTGKILPEKFEYQPDSSKNLPLGELISNEEEFSSSVQFRLFDYGQTLENIDSLRAIRINMEHSNSSELEIRLKCPNNTEVVLKNADGDAAFLGEPVVNEDNFWDRGKAYNYSWVNSPAFGTMSESSVVLFHDYKDVLGNEYTNQSYLPSGTYASYQSLKALVGCPMNGDWTLTIVDHAAINNGFVFSWALVFSDKIEAGMWEFENKYDYRDAYWYNENNDVRSLFFDGTAFAQRIEGEHQAFEYKDHEFMFVAIDNFGCTYDTSITVKIVKPDIVMTPEEGEVPIDVSFKTEAKWVNNYNWNFGDRTTSIESAPQHEYTEGGTSDEPKYYEIILTATSETGCVDKDTVKFKAREPSSNFTVPNIFTPESTINNIFKVVPGGTDEVDPKNGSKRGDDQILRFESFDFKIYSRWGGLIFSTDNWEEGWDGTINGNRNAEEAVYFYAIKAVGKDKKKHNKKGHLLLYRGTN